MRKFLAGTVEFVQVLVLLVAVFTTQGALYFVVLVALGVALVLFFFLLSLLPEGISSAITATLEVLARIARIGVRDAPD